MGQDSKIEWTHHTFNPWRGCTKVSDGCRNCYAETLSGRNPGSLGVWGPNGKRVVGAEAYWRLPIKWNREAEQAGERGVAMSPAIKTITPFLVEPKIGDLATFHDGEGWVTGVIIGVDVSEAIIAWGDVWRRVEHGLVITASRERMNREAGELIGTRFSEIQELRRKIISFSKEGAFYAG